MGNNKKEWRVRGLKINNYRSKLGMPDELMILIVVNGKGSSVGEGRRDALVL